MDGETTEATVAATEEEVGTQTHGGTTLHLHRQLRYRRHRRQPTTPTVQQATATDASTTTEIDYGKHA